MIVAMWQEKFERFSNKLYSMWANYYYILLELQNCSLLCSVHLCLFIEVLLPSKRDLFFP